MWPFLTGSGGEEAIGVGGVRTGEVGAGGGARKRGRGGGVGICLSLSVIAVSRPGNFGHC